ncbi:MAG: amidohydrolase family protein [SAR202 cluster bacterium]|nr:amidohydrolase family protein [SAR202 cluster bacterium]
MFDLLIRGGTVVDGTGNPGRAGDVGVIGDRIVAVGELSSPSPNEVIDATGRVVAPGFIDIHSHSDFTLLLDPRALSQLYQGVTTEVIGNCGHGCAPVKGAIEDIRANIYGYKAGLTDSWHSVGEYLSVLEAARPAVNVAALVPHGNLRLACVSDTARPANRDEMAAMGKELARGLDDGAWGYSLGLEYPAERASSPSEIVALARISAGAGGLFAVHTRNREKLAVEGVQEAVDLALESGARLQLSHVIPRRGGPPDALQQCLGALDAARARGAEVGFDIHTRLHGITNLVNVLPAWATENGQDAAIAMLRDPALRERIRKHESIITSFGLGGWDRVSIFAADRQSGVRGKSIQELAARGSPLDAIFDLLIAEHEAGGDFSRIICLAHSYDEKQLLDTLRHAACGVGSDATALCADGPLAGETFLGAYTWAGWLIRRAVRETRTLTLEVAIARLTGMPASRLGLKDRGLLKPGMAADIIVLDPAKFEETGSLEAPNRYARGVDALVVNGKMQMAGGRPTGKRAGRVLRR